MGSTPTSPTKFGEDMPVLDPELNPDVLLPLEFYAVERRLPEKSGNYLAYKRSEKEGDKDQIAYRVPHIVEYVTSEYKDVMEEGWWGKKPVKLPNPIGGEEAGYVADKLPDEGWGSVGWWAALPDFNATLIMQEKV